MKSNFKIRITTPMFSDKNLSVGTRITRDSVRQKKSTFLATGVGIFYLQSNNLLPWKTNFVLPYIHYLSKIGYSKGARVEKNPSG